jgi:hypothetical protein
MSEPIAKRHVVLAAVPLAVIASGILVAPLVVAGYPAHITMLVRPLEDGFSPFFAIYLAAAVLAFASWRATRSAEPVRGHAAIAGGAAVLVVAGMGFSVAFFFDGGYWGQGALFALPIAGSVWLLIGGLRRRGWTRALWLLGAFASASLPFGCPLIPGLYNLYSAGILFEIADLTVLALVVLGIVRSHREP